jgi:hypothetical protein
MRGYLHELLDIPPLPPRMHLHPTSKSVWSKGLRSTPRAIKDPCTPLLKHPVIKLFSWRSIHPEPTLVPQSSSRLELRLVRLGLEGDQAMLGFLMLARAWFGISLVLYSISLFHWDCIVATMFMSTLSFISFMLLKAMFIVCSSFISGVSRLWKPCICLYSAHPIGPWVSDRHYVSVVLRYLFICGCPYISGRVVDRVGDSLRWVLCSPSPVYIDVGRTRSRRIGGLCFQLS